MPSLALLLVTVACSGDADEARRVWGGPPVEPLDVKATLSAKSVALLEPVTCTVDVYVGKDCEVAFTPAVPEGFRGEVRQAPSRSLGAGEWRRFALELRPTALGTRTIPPFKVEQSNGDAVVTSGELELEVTTRLADASADVEAPAPPFPPGVEWWPWLAGGGAVIAAALALWWWRRRRPRPTRLVETPPLPHVKALRALSRLRQARRVTPAEIDSFYVEVSQVLRVYLEERFGLHAPERTTEEFLIEVQASPALDPGQRRELQGFLSQCDLVKFARVVPAAEVHELVLAQAENFVEGTRADRARQVVA